MLPDIRVLSNNLKPLALIHLIVMIAVIALSIYSRTLQDTNTVRFIPKSQSPFERSQTIRESSSTDQFGLVFLSDERTTDKLLKALSNSEKNYRIRQIFRKESDGQMTSWNAKGEVVKDGISPTKVADFGDLKAGEVGIIFDWNANKRPQMANDPVQVNMWIETSPRVTSVEGPSPMVWQKVGTPVGRFSNISIQAQVHEYLGSLSKIEGNSVTIGTTTHKFVGLMPDTADNRVHAEVETLGSVGRNAYSISPIIDWGAYEKDFGTEKGRDPELKFQIIRKPGEAQSSRDIHFDISSSIPFKYWTGFSIIQATQAHGFFSHVPMTPGP